MKLALSTDCECRKKIDKFMHRFLYKARQPFPAEGSIIECDCGNLFKMKFGLWMKGDWSEEFSGMQVSYSSPPASSS